MILSNQKQIYNIQTAKRIIPLVKKTALVKFLDIKGGRGTN